MSVGYVFRAGESGFDECGEGLTEVMDALQVSAQTLCGQINPDHPFFGGGRLIAVTTEGSSAIARAQSLHVYAQCDGAPEFGAQLTHAFRDAGGYGLEVSIIGPDGALRRAGELDEARAVSLIGPIVDAYAIARDKNQRSLEVGQSRSNQSLVARALAALHLFPRSHE